MLHHRVSNSSFSSLLSLSYCSLLLLLILLCIHMLRVQLVLHFFVFCYLHIAMMYVPHHHMYNTLLCLSILSSLRGFLCHSVLLVGLLDHSAFLVRLLCHFLELCGVCVDFLFLSLCDSILLFLLISL